MRIFVTASTTWTGLFWKEYLERQGHIVKSTWHNIPMTRTSQLEDGVKADIADDSWPQIQNSDVLLVISDPDMVPGGKFVDVGYALGSGKKVILVGRRENLKMYSRRIVSVDTPSDVTRVFTEWT